MKVCFLSWHFATPQIFLDSLIKMTPGRSGKWKDMEATIYPFEADFCVIMDGYNGPFPEERAIYIGEHPNCCTKSFRKWEDKKALKKLHLDDYVNPGEWWIRHDYDYLSTLKPPTKTKQAACVMTYQSHDPMYVQRVKFIEALAEYQSGGLNMLDLYGRPEEKFRVNPILKYIYKGCLGHNKPDGTKGEHLTGKELLIDYKYTLEFDVGPTKNYFSERFYDSLLLWCVPIYFGSNNVHNFIPRGAFEYVDIYDLKSVNKVTEMISEPPDTRLEEIAFARDLLLNTYQLWPYIYKVIKNI